MMCPSPPEMLRKFLGLYAPAGRFATVTGLFTWALVAEALGWGMIGTYSRGRMLGLSPPDGLARERRTPAPCSQVSRGPVLVSAADSTCLQPSSQLWRRRDPHHHRLAGRAGRARGPHSHDPPAGRGAGRRGGPLSDRSPDRCPVGMNMTIGREFVKKGRWSVWRTGVCSHCTTRTRR